MKRGIPMCEIDRMDILRYLDVLAREIEQGDTKGGTADLPKGTIEDVFG